MKLTVGDIVVVPVMGVGTVRSTEAMDVGDGPIPGYRIELGPEDGFFWIHIFVIRCRQFDLSNIFFQQL